MSEAMDKLMTAAREVATDSAMPEKARAVARALVSIVPLLEQAERIASEAVRQRDVERLDVLAWLETERPRWARDVGEVFDRIADQIASGAHVGSVKDITIRAGNNYEVDITPYVPTPDQDRINITITNDTDEPRCVTAGWSGFAPSNGR